MHNSEDLRLLKTKGYTIINLPNKNYLIQVRAIILNEMNSILKTNISDIEKMRSLVGSLNLKSLDKIRNLKLKGLSEKLIKAVGNKTKIVGKDLLYLQRYPHLNLNIANINESKTFNKIISYQSAGSKPLTNFLATLFHKYCPNKAHNIITKNIVKIYDSASAITSSILGFTYTTSLLGSNVVPGW